MKNKILPAICAAALLFAPTAHAAPPTSEEAVHHYRVTMKEAGEALKNNQAQTSFQKILPMAEQGFAEAQYIIATMYHDGEGTPQDLQAAKKWYTAAVQQTTNQEIVKLAKEGLDELK